MGQHPWAVLLAGGDGTRLQSLTHRISGDSRPKQFCRLIAGKSLLSQTKERLNPMFPCDRTLFAVTRAHEVFYREELSDADQLQIVAQPQNRGTAVAIAASLLRIAQTQADALVALFPCDHYYSNEEAFLLSVGSALAFAVDHPESIILLGAEAHYPEVEYGWIETGPAIPNSPVFRVNRFWEKPSLRKARSLWRRGCLWNTFVSIGYASTFLELLRLRRPDVLRSLEDSDLDGSYQNLAPADFSREILTPLPNRLLVVRDVGSGWADLGSPTRVISTLVRNRIEPAWLSKMRTV